jgi:3-hydroxyisobutyrate dehydrogenase-like beta-hydroxyacid dehydrogenase
MALAQHAASTVSTPLPLGNAATEIYAAMNGANGQKFADKDFSVVYEYLRQQVRKQV